MKTVCWKCGIHFPQDFEQTLECGYWELSNLQDLPTEYKKKIWDWQFAMPIDEIFLATGYSISFNVYGEKENKNPTWQELNPEYENLTEEEKQNYQREMIKPKKPKSWLERLWK